MALAAALLLATGADAGELTREEAIERARPLVGFEPERIEAEAADEDGRPVWRVVFRGPPTRPGLGRYAEVLVDRATGEIIGLVSD